MNEIGYFTQSKKIKESLRGRKIYYNPKTPDLFACPELGLQMTRDTLDEMAAQGFFIYNNIEVEQGSIDDVIKLYEPPKKINKTKIFRIVLFSFIAMALLVSNFIIIVFFK